MRHPVGSVTRILRAHERFCIPYNQRTLPPPSHRWITAAAVVSACVASPAAFAHGLDANQIQLVLHGETAEVVATAPAEFATLADANGDGLITLDELNPHRAAVRDALVAAMQVTDDDGHAPAVERSDVSLPRADDSPGDGRDFSG